jgi:ABC-type nitrate/sulfonate/bicarbonate transport system substrate-binding protein
MGIGVLNDGPIKTPKDLEGRQLASTVTSGEYPFLPAFAENAGFDLEKVTRIQVDNKVRDRLLSEGKVDAISGYASSAMPTYIATGVKARFMLFSDYGLLNYGTALLTQPKRLAEESELCAAFVDGALQGLKATMLDPAEAMKVFFKQVPEMALATQAREQIRVGTGINIYVSARHHQSKRHGLYGAQGLRGDGRSGDEIRRPRHGQTAGRRRHNDQPLCRRRETVCGRMGADPEERAGVSHFCELTGEAVRPLAAGMSLAAWLPGSGSCRLSRKSPT